MSLAAEDRGDHEVAVGRPVIINIYLQLTVDCVEKQHEMSQLLICHGQIALLCSYCSLHVS